MESSMRASSLLQGLFVLAAAATTACAATSEVSEGEVGEHGTVEPKLCTLLCPPPGGDTVAPDEPPVDNDLAYVTFYSGPNLDGSSFTVSGKTATSAPLIQLFDASTLTSKGFYQNVGSVKITCGTRSAIASVFSDANSTFTGSAPTAPLPYEKWSGSGASVECTAGKTGELRNLASMTDLQGRTLAGRVRSATFYAHAPTRHPLALDIDGQVLQRWINTIKASLPSGASVRKEATIKMVGWSGFELRQDIYLDHWACTRRSATFTLSAAPSRDAAGVLSWRVSVKQSDSYVDTGFGDSWGCREGMKSALASGARSAASKFATALNDIASVIVPKDAKSYYFAPRNAFTKFDLHSAF
jgi:hypothetical protein